MKKRWQIHPTLPPPIREQFSQAGYSSLLAQLLYNRGITTLQGAEAFFFSESEGNPFDLPEMSQAVTRLRQAIRKGEQIVVYGDYDADGVTATALLTDVLGSLGARVEAHIPHRADEGYGLNVQTFEELHGRGCTLVVSVDCGIRSVAEAEFARSIGMDLIITDHHSVGEGLPPAVARIDPKRADSRYPFQDLSGVGVAYKLAQALLRSHKQVPVQADVRPIEEEALLDLVALGTVADLAPIVGENRILVKRGLERLNQTDRPGLLELIATSRLQRPISANRIGYVLGPRLNAAGRLDTAMASYRLLTTRFPDEARALAVELEQYNRERQQLTIEAVAKAREIVLRTEETPPLVFVAAPDILGGIAGLVASRLAEEFYRPSVVVEIADDVSRGSARSIPEINITDALDQCSDILERHGGHAAAAGFEVQNDLLDALHQRLLDIADRELDGEELSPTLVLDAEVSLSQMTWEAMSELQRLEPHGYGNRRPVFVSRRVQVKDSRIVGERHLKLSVSDGHAIWDAIAFRQADKAQGLPFIVDIAFTLEINSWNGQDRLQLNVKDIRPSEG
jgi:single-stranded-DNA-specific exonuclease